MPALDCVLGDWLGHRFTLVQPHLEGASKILAGDIEVEARAPRLERIAVKLGPRFVGFVGKEAYRGAFGDRPALGLQGRRLGDTQLFVLPSTSPANAAVPYGERLRWFRELAALSRASGS